MRTSQAPAHFKPLVLVIESDARTQRLVSQAIDDAGGTPVVAASQADATGVLTTLSDQIALVILDLAAKGIDAFGFRRLQLGTPSVASIPLMTLSYGALSREQAAHLRPVASVAMPFRLHDVRESVRVYIGAMAHA